MIKSNCNMKWIVLISLFIYCFAFCVKFFYCIITKHKKLIGSLFQNLKVLMLVVFLFNNSKWIFQGNRNGWFEFFTFDSFDIVEQFLRWSLSFSSDGNRIQVPWMFCVNVIKIFISADFVLSRSQSSSFWQI